MPLPSPFPDLAALDLFVSVVRTGSISRAAEVHGISQPSASNRIRTLERQLGFELLERTAGGSLPTTTGTVVAGWAEEVLRAAHELGAGVEALRARRSGRLRIAASYTIAEYLLPSWLERFHRERPDDAVELEVANSATVLQRLRAGAAELGFVESPGATPGLHHRVVGRDELVTVVGRDHPWARVGTVPLLAFLATPLVVREQGSGTRDALTAALDARGAGRAMIALELGSTSAIKAAVIDGLSPAVLSDLAVAGDLEAGRLVAVAVEVPPIRRTLRAVWPRRPAPSPAIRALLARLPDLAPG